METVCKHFSIIGDTNCTLYLSWTDVALCNTLCSGESSSSSDILAIYWTAIMYLRVELLMLDKKLNAVCVGGITVRILHVRNTWEMSLEKLFLKCKRLLWTPAKMKCIGRHCWPCVQALNQSSWQLHSLRRDPVCFWKVNMDHMTSHVITELIFFKWKKKKPRISGDFNSALVNNWRALLLFTYVHTTVSVFGLWVWVQEGRVWACVGLRWRHMSCMDTYILYNPHGVLCLSSVMWRSTDNYDAVSIYDHPSTPECIKLYIGLGAQDPTVHWARSAGSNCTLG